MSQEATFLPIPTNEIPRPVLELVLDREGESPAIPRVLLQNVASARAERRLLVLTALLGVLGAFELALYFRMPPRDALVVYQESPRNPLVQVRP